MLHLTQIEEIHKRLNEIPALVDLQQNRSFSFAEKMLWWLKKVELDMERGQLPEISKMSALRSKLITAIHRSDSNSANRRKHIEFTASMALQEAQQIIHDVISPKLEKYKEAEDIAAKLLAVASTKGYLDEVRKITKGQEKLRHLESILSQDSDTRNAMTHLKGLIGIFDTLIILDRASASYGF